MKDSSASLDVLIGFVWTMKSLHVWELEGTEVQPFFQESRAFTKVCSGVPWPKVSKLT